MFGLFSDPRLGFRCGSATSARHENSAFEQVQMGMIYDVCAGVRLYRAVAVSV